MGNNIPAGCSPLATYYNDATYYDRGGRIYNGTQYTIDTITIHCYTVQVTAKEGCDRFAARERDVSSCNYVVGYDGSIGVSVPEPYRSYCTGGDKPPYGPMGALNDYRAVTIEVASEAYGAVNITEKAYNSLVQLVFDICSRNGINKLTWSNNITDRVFHKKGCNMTVHRDYADKECPGQTLYDAHGAIAATVNDWLTRAAGDISFEPGIPPAPGGIVFVPGPIGHTPVPPPIVEIDTVRLLVRDITATELTAVIHTNKNFAKYSWSYLITPLGNKNTETTKFRLFNENTAITIGGLIPNTAYAVEVNGTGTSGTTVRSQRLLICTKQTYPGSVSNLQAKLDTQRDFCSISFTAPNSWGEFSESSSHKGYRVSLLINGMVRTYSDKLISYSSGNINKNIPMATLFKDTSLQPIDIIQIGIQTWVTDTKDGKIFDSNTPVCSKPIYLHVATPKVDKQYLKLGNNFKRVILHNNIKVK